MSQVKDLLQNHTVVDVVELAGTSDMLGLTISRVLGGRLVEVLENVDSPGILCIDFRRVRLTEQSVLEQSVVKAIARALQNAFVYKLVVCSNTSASHRTMIERVLAVWSELEDAYRERERERLLLLVSGRETPDVWFLLGKGELTAEERLVWDLLADRDCMSYYTIIQESGFSEKELQMNLEVFVRNRVIIYDDEQSPPAVCSMVSLLNNLESVQ